jgi:hypothetical protein
MKILVFLQNPWSPLYAGGVWPRRSWLKALQASRSGQRLRSLENGYMFAGAEWCYDNANPVCGADAASFMEADIHHMVVTVRKRKPDVIVALGKESGRGAMIACAHHPLVILAPHPASRVLTNDLYRKIGSDLGVFSIGDFRNTSSLVSYKQERGRVVVDPDPWLVHRSIT